MLSLGVGGGAAHLEHEESCPDLGPSCASSSPPPAERHVTDLYSADLRLDAELGVLRWLSVGTTLWLRTLTEQTSYTDLRGAALASPPDAGIHHHNGTRFGPGDPWLTARAGGSRGTLAGSVRAGFTIPLGSTVEDPFALGARGIAHEHYQLGTGTVDPLLGLEGRWFLRRFSVGGWAFARTPFYENGHGYRAGVRLAGGAFVESKLGLKSLTFAVGLDVAHEEPEAWRSVLYSEGNLGRTDLLLSTGLQWRFADDWSLGLGARVELYTWVQVAQVTTPLTGELTITRAFELWESHHH